MAADPKNLPGPPMDLANMREQGVQNEQSDRTKAAAQFRAESLREVFAELADLSTTAAADALNERGIATPSGPGKWHAMQVYRVRARLGAR
jgi:hypothetical protein